MMLSMSPDGMRSIWSKSCSHCWTATKLAPSAPRPARHDRRGHRVVAFRVLRAVLVAGQVAIVRIAETVDRILQRKRRRQRTFDRPRTQHEARRDRRRAARPTSAGVAGSVRSFTANAGNSVRPAPGAEVRRQRMPEPDHRVASVDDLAQRGQRRGNIAVIRHRESEVSGRRIDPGSGCLAERRSSFPQECIVVNLRGPRQRAPQTPKRNRRACRPLRCRTGERPQRRAETLNTNVSTLQRRIRQTLRRALLC